VLPCYLRIKRDLDFGGDFNNKEGPLPVRRVPQSEWKPNLRAFCRARLARGLSKTVARSYNSRDAIGLLWSSLPLEAFPKSI